MKFITTFVVQLWALDNLKSCKAAVLFHLDEELIPQDFFMWTGRDV